MDRKTVVLLMVVAELGLTSLAVAATAQRTSSVARREIIHVAPPTGDRTKDHANIVAAFRRARPGDTVQFARGMYVVGNLIRVPTPRLTLLGDANGTVLRGCNPVVYEQRAREEARIISELIKSHRGTRPGARWRNLVQQCGMFQLTGGRDVVRNLTFEYMRLGVMLGYRYQLGRLSTEGGYLVEGNTFRNSDNSIRIGVSSPDATVIRHNTVVDTYHAVMAGGSNIRILDNTILAPTPGSVPGQQHPSEAVAIVAIAPSGKDAPTSPDNRCTHNVIAGNIINGYPDGIEVTAFPGTVCSANVIHDNTVAVRRAALLRSSVDFGLFPLPDKAHPSFVGVPIQVAAPAFHGRSGRVVNNRIEGNRILGAEGYGIAVVHGSHNRIADNMITGVVLRDPFPGNASGSPSPNANGAGIWISTGSDGNEITGNAFEDIAASAIVVEGDRNLVKVRRSGDVVHDLGTGNRVTVPKGDHQAKTQDQLF